MSVDTFCNIVLGVAIALNFTAAYFANKRARKLPKKLKPIDIQRMVEWVAADGKIEFEKTASYCATSNRRIDCDLSIRDERGNRVYTQSIGGKTVESAFDNAILKIEETIGSAWRVLPVCEGEEVNNG
jgi:hypothetical protein